MEDEEMPQKPEGEEKTKLNPLCHWQLARNLIISRRISPASGDCTGTVG